jgi:WD40 repeat protein
LSPDRKLLAIAGGDTTLHLYDTATWKKTAQFDDFSLETFALAFTPDGKYLLAGGADSRITLLDPGSARQVRQLPPEPGSYLVDLLVYSRGERAVAAYFDNAGEKPPHVLIWDLAAGKSTPLQTESMPTCGGIVNNKLWLGMTAGKMLTISEYK